MRYCICIVTALCLGRIVSVQASEPILTRVPDGGIQPQVLLTSDRTTHLVYFKGEADAGNLFYVRRPGGHSGFGTVMRVNSKSNSAVAIGTIRGAQIAAGKDGRVHVVWNGSPKYKTESGPPLFYTRLMADGNGFEPERNVIGRTDGLDGGASVAADGHGKVYVVWHASMDHTGNEEERAVFLAESIDEGQTFAHERRIGSESTGACACCGLKAYVNPQGNVFVMYRTARHGMERDEILLASTNGARTFASVYKDPWKTATCPMSSAWLTESGKRTVAAWETIGKVHFGRLDLEERTMDELKFGAEGRNQKYPVCATNVKGEMLLAWCEGIKWGNTGTIRWQILDEKENATSGGGSIPGLPAWSFLAVTARDDGRFELMY